MITIYQINRAGLDVTTILKYQSTDKVKTMIQDIINGNIMPKITFYPPVNGKYTIADGIHRFCAYLYLGILLFDNQSISAY